MIKKKRNIINKNILKLLKGYYLNKFKKDKNLLEITEKVFNEKLKFEEVCLIIMNDIYLQKDTDAYKNIERVFEGQLSLYITNPVKQISEIFKFDKTQNKNILNVLKAYVFFDFNHFEMYYLITRFQILVSTNYNYETKKIENFLFGEFSINAINVKKIDIIHKSLLCSLIKTLTEEKGTNYDIIKKLSESRKNNFVYKFNIDLNCDPSIYREKLIKTFKILNKLLYFRIH